mgnify:CR=1 FL=1
MVLRFIKYSFIYLAAIIMLLHNLIPHSHESELNSNQHTQVHQTEINSPIALLGFIFHEFTEEGEMEDILVNANTNVSLSAVFTVLLMANKTLSVILAEEKETKQYFFPLNEHYQTSGFSTAWSVRPPPFA